MISPAVFLGETSCVRAQVRDRKEKFFILLCTSPCKAELSSPLFWLCKYGLLDQTVPTAHTHTDIHTFFLSLTPVLWGLGTHTMVSLRASQPASLPAIRLIPAATDDPQRA